MDGVMFRVGDWVRRKPEHQDAGQWNHGDQVLCVTRVHGSYLDFEGMYPQDWGWMCVTFELARERFDPHALGMALVLAGEIAEEWHGGPDAFKRCDEAYAVAYWLRACVTEALLSQEAE